MSIKFLLTVNTILKSWNYLGNIIEFSLLLPRHQSSEANVFQSVTVVLISGKTEHHYTWFRDFCCYAFFSISRRHIKRMVQTTNSTWNAVKQKNAIRLVEQVLGNLWPPCKIVVWGLTGNGTNYHSDSQTIFVIDGGKTWSG